MATNQSITDGIPTARNVDHFGYNVPNLDEAIEFFVEVLGAEEAFRWGPMADPDGDSMAAMLGVHPRTSVGGALLRLGPASNVELLEYDAPDEASEPPKTADPGASQLAFRVGDVEAATEYLREQQGVTVLDEPGEVPDDRSRRISLSSLASVPCKQHSCPIRSLLSRQSSDGCCLGRS